MDALPGRVAEAVTVTLSATAPPASPDVAYEGRQHDPEVARPSWSVNPGYLDDGHRSVYAETKDIPGWQMEHDAYKLYEMAWFAGDVVLDLGAYGGRSAVVELKGALANPARVTPPQVFSLDLDHAAIGRSHETLKAFGLDASVLLFLGGVGSFFQTFHVGPTMVFVDADHRYEGVRDDLAVLSQALAPGVPVLCHDYLNSENDTGEYGVRRAATEWEESGFVRYMGAFGACALFLTTDKCRGVRQRLSDEVFALRRDAGLVAYGLLPSFEPSGGAVWRMRAETLEEELAAVRSSRSYRLARAFARLGRPVRRLARRTAPGTGKARA
jgi:hypothetical protein